MNSLSHLLHCDGRTARLPYLRNILLLAAGKAAIDLQVLHLRPDLASSWSWGSSWIDPYQLIRPWLDGHAPSLIACTTLAFFTALIWNSVHRARHAGWDHRIGLAMVLPFVNVGLALALSVWPMARRRSVFDLP